MKLNTWIDIIAWIFAFYWIIYLPFFTIETHPISACIAITVLVWRCVPYIVQDEYE